jgi:hypothetical protein
MMKHSALNTQVRNRRRQNIAIILAIVGVMLALSAAFSIFVLGFSPLVAVLANVLGFLVLLLTFRRVVKSQGL